MIVELTFLARITVKYLSSKKKIKRKDISLDTLARLLEEPNNLEKVTSRSSSVMEKQNAKSLKLAKRNKSEC
jgi:hypothetical protein